MSRPALRKHLENKRPLIEPLAFYGGLAAMLLLCGVIALYFAQAIIK
jgi:hypothetical protein